MTLLNTIIEIKLMIKSMLSNWYLPKHNYLNMYTIYVGLYFIKKHFKH